MAIAMAKMMPPPGTSHASSGNGAPCARPNRRKPPVEPTSPSIMPTQPRYTSQSVRSNWRMRPTYVMKAEPAGTSSSR
jgi:hypothetical protein